METALDVDSLLPGRSGPRSIGKTDREKIILAIGYDPVRVSIAGHPEIRETFRTAIDRDTLVSRIEPLLTEARGVKSANRDDALNVFMSKFPSMSDEEDTALVAAFDAVWAAAQS